MLKVREKDRGGEKEIEMVSIGESMSETDRKDSLRW